MKLKTSLTVAAAFLVFLGFGMIHGSHMWVEKTGSVLIGIGSLYLIVRLVPSVFNKENK